MELTQSTFSKYALSENDQIIGSTLTTLTKQFIQNQICNIAEQRIALVPDPNNYAEFIQQEAYLKGQMDSLKFLLDSSNASEQALLEAAKQNSQP
jgi:hypothetical protein